MTGPRWVAIAAAIALVVAFYFGSYFAVRTRSDIGHDKLVELRYGNIFPRAICQSLYLLHRPLIIVEMWNDEDVVVINRW
jgi:hypothetical protein